MSKKHTAKNAYTYSLRPLVEALTDMEALPQ